MKRVRYHFLLAFVLLLATSISGCLEGFEWEYPEPMEPEGHSDDHDDHHDQSHAHSHDHEDEHDHDEGDDHQDPADAYEDADPRYHNHVDGEEESRRTINVPEHTHTLRVALIHDSHDEYRFRIYEPQPLDDVLPLFESGPEAEEKGEGHKYMDEPEWFVVHDPAPGDWTFTIDIEGCSKYTVGFYLE